MIEAPLQLKGGVARLKAPRILVGLGERDGSFLLEAPENVAAVALSMAVGASGQITSEVTALLDMNEAQDAMRRATSATFRPPS